MDGNKPCPATGTYRPRCGCAVEVDVKRDEMAPPCPKCGTIVSWTFVRSHWLDPTQDFKPHLRKRPEDAGGHSAGGRAENVA